MYLAREVTLSAELQLKNRRSPVSRVNLQVQWTLIDDKEAGTTPVYYNRYENREYTMLQLVWPVTKNWYEKVDIKSDFENSFKAILHKITGSITIKKQSVECKYLFGW